MGTNSKLRSAGPIATRGAALLAWLCVWSMGGVSVAQPQAAPLQRAQPQAATQPIDPSPLDHSPLKLPGVIRLPIGVTRASRPIEAFITDDDLDIHSPKNRWLIVAGLDGSVHTAQAAIHVMERFYTLPEFEPLRKRIALSVVPAGNPDGLALGLRSSNGSGGDPSRGYPPPGDAYVSPTAPEAQYLWRWIGMHAPDHVFELVEGVANHVVPAAARPSDTLAAQLEKVPACQVGLIPATSWSVPPGNTTPFAEVAQLLLQEIARGNASLDQVHKSAARRELELRDSRTALEVAQQLARVYGHDLPSVAYIPAVACIGRLRLAKLTGDRAMVDDVQRIASESARGTQPTLTDKSSGSELAGHILFGELFDATGDKAWNPLVQRAADWAFTAEGQPREAMPTHNEMSDAVFMGCPILAQAGRLTGERKYWDMCVQHLRFMRKLDLRPDGLYRHSPLDETAWGRGNGFPALGLALALADVPADYSGRQEMLAAFQAHLSALLEHQDPTGAWHQVVDHPESYRELTSTCMITYAMTRGVRAGWLEKATFEQPIARGWKAIKSRVAADGTLVDVCTGTGKMKSLREYLDRPAILGRDGRGGAMALLVATEIAAWEAE